ncbi:MAG: aldolase [Stellaceae bacterium]
MVTTFDQSKGQLTAQAADKMRGEFGDGGWTLRQKIALVSRVLFDEGHASGLAGQITVRGESPNSYFTQRLGLGLDEIAVSNLILVDEDLTVLEGQGMPNPANRFHSWIYRARPDVKCIIHTHAPNVSALSMLEIPLVVSHMDTSPLYEDCALLPKWPGVPFGNEEGKIISEALEDKRAILLAHHGLLVACPRLEEACHIAILFEKAAKLQLLAMAAGEIQAIGSAPGREAHNWELGEANVDAEFQYRVRRILRAHPDCLD